MRQGSPAKIDKDNIMHSDEIKFQELSYDKYRDMEGELEEHQITEFILSRA